MYAEEAKEQFWRSILMSYSKPGFEWDAARSSWKPVDYLNMSVEDMAKRRREAADSKAELEAQLKGLIPAAAAQVLLNRSSEDLYDLLIKLAKKAPETLLGAI